MAATRLRLFIASEPGHGYHQAEADSEPVGRVMATTRLRGEPLPDLEHVGWVVANTRL
jgi:hypothetical protein